jgi:HEAT repeat protein
MFPWLYARLSRWRSWLLPRYQDASPAEDEAESADDRAADSLEVLLVTARSPQWSAAIRAIERLGDRGDPQAFDTLASLLVEGKDEWVMASAAQALGKLQDRRAIPILLDAFRATADRALLATYAEDRHLHPERTPDATLAAVQFAQDIQEIRAHAAEALGLLQSQEAIPVFHDALATPDLTTPTTAIVHALEHIGTVEAYELLAQWRVQHREG